MRKSQGPVVALLLAAVLTLAGCSQWLESPAKPANDAIAVANGHLEKAASLEEQVQTKVADLESLPATKDGASQGLEITKGLRDTIASEKTELASAKDAMDGVAKLEVADDYKKYAELESKTIDTRITMTDTTLRLFDAMDVLYNSLQKGGTKVEPQQIQAVIAQVKQELTDLSTQASDEAQAAADYFTSKGLGK